MSQGDSVEEKLVEEMRIEHWCKHCDRWWPFPRAEREPLDPPGYCEEDADNDCNKRVLGAIARIGKAYADGELMLTKMPPKLPGEVGRSKGTYLPRIGECETIALRQEEEA